jgi:hypothetical protein
MLVESGSSIVCVKWVFIFSSASYVLYHTNSYTHTHTNARARAHTHIRGDYKWCERLHKFIGKKVRQKLYARHCKEQLKVFFFFFFCMHDKMYEPFFFGKNTVNGIIYRDILELWLMPQLLQDKPNVFKHGGAPPHIHNEVTTFLNRRLTQRWIGRGGGGVHFLAAAICRSDLTRLFPVGLCEK